MKKATAQKLAKEHWQYVSELLESEIPDEMSYSKREYIDNIGKHYQAALVHGIKHGTFWKRQRGKN